MNNKALNQPEFIMNNRIEDIEKSSLTKLKATLNPTTTSVSDDSMTDSDPDSWSSGPCHYSWSGSRKNRKISEKLDRAMANFDWNLSFPNSFCNGLPIQRSDHGPLIISTKLCSKEKHRPFKLDHFLSSFPGYQDILVSAGSTTFSPPLNSPSQVFILNSKLKNIKCAIKSWNSNRVGNIFQHIKNIQQQLSVPQNSPHILMNSHYDINLRSQLDFLLIVQEQYWIQRDKLLRICNGDVNTKFFHSSIKHKTKINSILEILDDNNVLLTDENDIMDHCRDYFLNLYTSNNNTNSYSHTSCTLVPSTINNISAKLFPDQILELDRPFSHFEVKEAIFQMRPDKSPGPDDFPVDFFQDNWTLMGD
ncbi:hypothetical protein LIER_21101 [Lithospermum erythrorhizon]|uniref:Endonuclease/exonuclease/phosphatase domain-containing protein n=1 Tax=Lithospermum erythrorhizon TaxID=34254 RepID=A0AAV3QP13_LITER